MRGRSVALMTMALGVGVAAAGGLTIKLGSLAPAGSPWELGLKKLAAEWERISGGQVTVRIYAGGVAGDEPDMIRKVRIGTLNAAYVTVTGLQGIFNGLKTLSYPLLIRSDAEMAHVLGRMRPTFEAELVKRGFKPVMWSTAGWVYFFSRQAVLVPDDLKKQKLWVWSGDPDEVQAYQGAGFQTVSIAATDLVTSLQAGMVDALVTSPLVAASNQWFGTASHMLNLRLAPLWGAAIVSTKAWAEVPADLQPKLEEAAQRVSDAMLPEVLKADAAAIDVMKKYGLAVTEPTPAATRAWADLFDRTFSGLVGKMYDRDSFTAAQKYLAEYLAAHPRR